MKGTSRRVEYAAPKQQAPATVQTLLAKPSVPSSQPSASPSSRGSLHPSAKVEQDLARVAFVKTRHRAEGVRSALALLGKVEFGKKNVFVKPNFNSADPAPGSTHNEVLRTVVEMLREMGAETITVGDRSGMGVTRRVMEQKGVFAMADEMGFEPLVFDEMGAEQWLVMQVPGSHWAGGFPFARPVLEADAVVEACCLKTHRFGGHFTLSLKNSVGMVAKKLPGSRYDYMGELHGSPYQRLMIAEVNTSYAPILIVLDGVEAFVSGGPESGKRVWAEVVLAGTDRVAIDAVGVAILRRWGTTPEVSEGPVFEQEQIARAVELGLGVTGPEKIRLVTGDAESESYAAEIREILTHG
jgi:uncharacterized protein (DUF362 family)